MTDLSCNETIDKMDALWTGDDMERGRLYCHLSADGKILHCGGYWTVSDADIFSQQFPEFLQTLSQVRIVDAHDLQQMDSTGALLFTDLISHLQKNGIPIEIQGLKKNYSALLNLVSEEAKQLATPTHETASLSFFYVLGRWIVGKIQVMIDFCNFFGQISVIFWRSLFASSSRIFWPGVASVIEEAGYDALPIVGLLAFLVGIVVTYQVVIELEVYNATIYVVDLIGIITLREFGPLIVAIVAAGRTSTAFAAQLGTMKVGEEIDALKTMGISPLQRLVLPKMLGLLVALPLLTVWADCFGVLGGMVMAKGSLQMHFITFLSRFQKAIPIRHYYVGLIKTPFFAMIIAAVGCFQGFQVAGTADSIGKKTTQSAVQAIFLIIVADALFSILFRIRGV